MGKKSSDPTPPRRTIAATMGANVNTAVANAYLNGITQDGPDGVIQLKETGKKVIHDRNTHTNYEIPTFTRYTTLSKENQDIKNQHNVAKFNLAKLGAEQSERISNILKEEGQFDNLPEWGNAKDVRPLNLQRVNYSPDLIIGNDIDFSKDRKNIENSLLERMRPQQTADYDRLESRLASQGIRIGSAPYKQAMADHAQGINDARLAAVMAAGDEQERMNKMALRHTSFRNVVLQDMFKNDMRRAAMHNRNTLRETNSDITGLSAKNVLRTNVIREKIAISNDPINKITALLRGSQVKEPKLQAARLATIPRTNVSHITSEYDRNKIRFSDINNTLFMDLFTKYLESDRRLKKDIAPVGKTNDGQTVYRFRYKSGGPIRMGLMADEVARKHPKAVIQFGEIKLVDYKKALQSAVQRRS